MLVTLNNVLNKKENYGEGWGSGVQHGFFWNFFLDALTSFGSFAMTRYVHSIHIMVLNDNLFHQVEGVNVAERGGHAHALCLPANVWTLVGVRVLVSSLHIIQKTMWIPGPVVTNKHFLRKRVKREEYGALYIYYLYSIIWGKLQVRHGKRLEGIRYRTGLLEKRWANCSQRSRAKWFAQTIIRRYPWALAVTFQMSTLERLDSNACWGLLRDTLIVSIFRSL